jgi:tetratricopeptide (TPR) repeat protein
VLGVHTEKDVQTAAGKRLARVFEDELGDITKAEETYRYVLGVEPLDAEALGHLDRIYTSIEQYPELAQVLEQRVRATQEAYELVELSGASVRSTRSSTSPTTRSRVLPHLRRARPRQRPAIRSSSGFTEGSWKISKWCSSASRNASGDSERLTSAQMAHLLADQLGDDRGRDGKRVLVCAARIGRPANPERWQWAELCDVLERHYDIAPDDVARVEVLLRRAKLFSEQLGRDDSALDDYNRVLDIDYANTHALYAISEIWRRRSDPQEIVTSLHQTVDRAAAALPAENLVAIFRELGTLYQSQLLQPYDAIDAWRAARVDPRPRGDGRTENLLRAEARPRPSTQDGPARPTRTRRRRSASTSRSRRSGSTRSARRTRARPPTRRSSSSTGRTIRPSSPWSCSTARRAGASR